jgi:NTP pyrophosphatase (non-canonical NTP hydrolase)
MPPLSARREMNNEEEQVLYKQAINLWGQGSQLDMVIEECAELIDKIQKYRRGRIAYFDIAEEFADVQNCINQFKGDFPDYEKIRQAKLERLAVIIKKESVSNA